MAKAKKDFGNKIVSLLDNSNAQYEDSYYFYPRINAELKKINKEGYLTITYNNDIKEVIQINVNSIGEHIIRKTIKDINCLFDMYLNDDTCTIISTDEDKKEVIWIISSSTTEEISTVRLYDPSKFGKKEDISNEDAREDRILALEELRDQELNEREDDFYKD